MKCSKCGAEIRNDSVFCPICGERIEVIEIKPEGVEQEVKQEKETTVVWNIFAIVGYVLGIVSVATCWCFGGFNGIPGIIFAQMGLKSNDPDKQEKARLGLKRSIIGLIISSVLLTIIIMVSAIASISEL